MARSLLEYVKQAGSVQEFEMRNPEMIIMALLKLGGKAHIDTIAAEYARIRHEKRPDLKWMSGEDAIGTVKACLRQNSHDCDPKAVNDFFNHPMKGEGYWGLNPGVYYNAEQKILTRTPEQYQRYLQGELPPYL